MADATIGALPNLADISDDALLVVEFQGAAYHATGAQWKAFAVAAAQGVNKGEPGDPGYSPTVDVTEIDGGHRLTVTDAEGTETADIMDGANGTSPTVTITAITGGHRVTITDATGTKYFDVLDGADGSGAGDMLSSAYDPDLAVKTAGGIPKYVDSIVGTINTALDEINGEVV